MRVRSAALAALGGEGSGRCENKSRKTVVAIQKSGQVVAGRKGCGGGKLNARTFSCMFNGAPPHGGSVQGLFAIPTVVHNGEAVAIGLWAPVHYKCTILLTDGKGSQDVVKFTAQITNGEREGRAKGEEL